MHTSEGLYFAFGATVCWAISVFPFTKAGRLMTVAGMNLVRLVLGTMLVFIAAIIVENGAALQIFDSGYLAAWGWLGLSGIMALGIGDYYGLRMYAILGPRFGSVLSTLSPAAALLFGYILLGESINYMGMAGMAITLAGVMGISLGRVERANIPNHGQGSVPMGILFGIVSALCNGSGLAFSKKAFTVQALSGVAIQPLTASFIRFFVATVIVILFLLIFRKLGEKIERIRRQPAHVLGLAATGTIFGPLIGVGLALFAIQTISVAVAQTIFALVPVVALVISHFVFKQRVTPRALAGIAIALLGVSILIWRNVIAITLGM